MEMRQQTARQLQDRRNSVLRTLDIEKAGRKDEDAAEGPDSTGSGAASSLGVAVSIPKRETARHESVNSLAINHDTRQNSKLLCAAEGDKHGGTYAETDPIAASSYTAMQDQSEIPGIAAAPEVLRFAVDSIQNSPPSRNVARKSASTPAGTTTKRSSQPQHRRPTPHANNLTSQLPVIVDQFPSYLNHWADHVFGRQRRYRNDKQSTSLEAYVVEDGRYVPIKIPFGHERLSFGLNRVLKDWRGDQWTNYLAASPETRLVLDCVAEAAREASNHEKICLAFKQYGVRDKMMPLLLAFFSLEPAKDPIIVILSDRRYSLPFAACRTLQNMEQCLREVCLNSSADASLLSLIDTRRYELKDQRNNNVIMPAFLIESLKPGIELRLLPSRRPAHVAWPDHGHAIHAGAHAAEATDDDESFIANALQQSLYQDPVRTYGGPPEGKAWGWAGEAVSRLRHAYFRWRMNRKVEPDWNPFRHVMQRNRREREFEYEIDRMRRPGKTASEPSERIEKDIMLHLRRNTRRLTIRNQIYSVPQLKHATNESLHSLSPPTASSFMRGETSSSLPNIHIGGNRKSSFDSDLLLYASSAPDITNTGRHDPVKCEDLDLARLSTHVGIPLGLSEGGSCPPDTSFWSPLEIGDPEDGERRSRFLASHDPLTHHLSTSVPATSLERPSADIAFSAYTSSSAPSRAPSTYDSFVDDDEGGDDLNLDVLNAGQEILRQDMSIDKWLELMTNVASITRGVDDT
ncbi:hypothetical protein NLG97_g9181 [Lecanicillium saksenae]|uniref:Uncharacterized protein n=1 Tax=Lecanicillium saksenae TaxID=468837 RepID=A0ACC1QGS1_9HYPO|nr:hypothetical protein NLG97_g9181 [Lecanicillium saksenae]